jgi:hypothetical protein
MSGIPVSLPTLATAASLRGVLAVLVVKRARGGLQRGG